MLPPLLGVNPSFLPSIALSVLTVVIGCAFQLNMQSQPNPRASCQCNFALGQVLKLAQRKLNRHLHCDF